MRNPAAPPSFAALVQSFFTEHLTQHRALSARTVAAYRDAFMLFLEFAQTRLHKPPTAMLLTDFTPALILGFLDHLESERHNAVRSRNARLAALRTFLKVSLRDMPAAQVAEDTVLQRPVSAIEIEFRGWPPLAAHAALLSLVAPDRRAPTGQHRNFMSPTPSTLIAAAPTECISSGPPPGSLAPGLSDKRIVRGKRNLSLVVRRHFVARPEGYRRKHK